jgi:ABC-type transport system substrate-binding protein
MIRGLRAARPFLPLVLLVVLALPAAAQPAGTMTWGAHVTLATRWLDTSETESEITPFMILYALHDALVKPMRQLQEMDRKKREEMLHQIQRVLADRVVFAPIWENGFIRAYGPRLEEAGLALIQAFPYSGPLEDVKLKKP